MSFYIKEPEKPAEASMIWMHGLGADSSDMMGLVNELSINSLALRHVFLDAPIRAVTLNGGAMMRAWYDIVGMQLTDREDKEGIEQSAEIIRKAYEEQINSLNSKRVFLAGFSQGGAMALYTALHLPAPLAGVVSLSAYLPLAEQCKTELDKRTPIFIASGQYDPIVLPQWTKQTASWLTKLGYNQLALHSYRMEHAICREEISDLSNWINTQIKGNF